MKPGGSLKPCFSELINKTPELELSLEGQVLRRILLKRFEDPERSSM